MEDFGTLVAQLREVMKRTDKATVQKHLPELLDVVRECGRMLDMDVQRKMHEYIFAHENGLEVLEKQHGADMRDPATGDLLEHKSMKLDDAGKGGMCNVNIVLPVWPANTERADYAEQVHQHVLTKGDVLIEARAMSNPKNNYTLRLRASFIARYAKEYVPYHRATHALGQLRHIGVTMAKSWEAYGIHALESVYPITGPGFLSVQNLGDASGNVVHLRHRDGIDVLVQVTKDMLGGFGMVTLAGTCGGLQLRFADTYHAFRTQLLGFVGYLRTGEPPVPSRHRPESRSRRSGPAGRETGS